MNVDFELNSRSKMKNLLTRCYDDFCHQQNMNMFYSPAVQPENEIDFIVLYLFGQNWEMIKQLPVVEGLAVVELDSF